ncbi:DinB family protein [uncultured Tenacibaculum sp.]|uniref:DinB family protein n=1 Tax=uncultured Tenacibaculum sp. TaxID=174713 RepID=UPI0026039318|nr:DinB family protein [uncultured Tenacibaculum sp.]
MRKIIAMLVISFLSVQCKDTTTLTAKEREFAITELNKSKDNLLKAIKDLNEAQFYFKVDENTWSIAECVEHVTLFVDEVFEILDESLELPANPDRRKDVKFSDNELLLFVQDRTTKSKTQEEFQPNKTYENPSETIDIFQEKLEKHIAYLENTKDDLRNHYVNFGTVDAYQIFLYMAAHTNRHIAQIEEIKKNKHFSKN